MTANEHFYRGVTGQSSDVLSAVILSDDAQLCALLQPMLSLNPSPQIQSRCLGSAQLQSGTALSCDLAIIDAGLAAVDLAELGQQVRSQSPQSRNLLLLDESELPALMPTLANLARLGIDQFLLKADLNLRHILALLQLGSEVAPAASIPLAVQTPARQSKVHTEAPSVTAPVANRGDIAHNLAIDLENRRVHIDAIPRSPLCQNNDQLMDLGDWCKQLDADSANSFTQLLDNATQYLPIPRQLTLNIQPDNSDAFTATLSDIQLNNNGQGRVIGASANLQITTVSEQGAASAMQLTPGFDNIGDGAALIEADKTWQNVTRSLPMHCLLLDEQGTIVRVINEGSETSQHLPQLAPGVKLAEALEIESLDQLAETISRTLNTGKAHQQIVACPGEQGMRWLDTHITRLRGDSGLSRQVVWSAFDITASRHAYQELLKNHDSLAQLLDDAPILFFQKDNAGRYLRVNRQFSETFDLRADVIAGRDDQEVFRDSQSGFVNVTREALQNKDKSTTREISYVEQNSNGARRFIWHTLLSLRPSDHQLDTLCGFGLVLPTSDAGDGSQSTTSTNVRSLEDAPANIAMTGALNQDFKLILNSLINYAELALSQKNQQRADIIAGHLQQVEATAHSTRNMLDGGDDKKAGGAQKKTAKSRALLLRPVIEEVVELLKPSLPSTLSFETVYSADKAKALVAEDAIKKIVMLLLLNAKSTAQSAGQVANDNTIRLTLETVTADQQECAGCASKLGDEYVALTVQTAARDLDDAALAKLVEAARHSTKADADNNVIALTHRVEGHALLQQGNNLLSLQLLFRKA